MADPIQGKEMGGWIDRVIGAGGFVVLLWTFFRNRRKERADHLRLEPVTQQEFQDHKTTMEKRLQQIEASIGNHNSMVVSSIATLSTKIDEREKAHQTRLNSIEELFGQVLSAITGKPRR